MASSDLRTAFSDLVAVEKDLQNTFSFFQGHSNSDRADVQILQSDMRRLTEEKAHLRGVLLSAGLPAECLAQPSLADVKAKAALGVKSFLPSPAMQRRRAPWILMGAKSKAAPKPKLLIAKSKAAPLPIGARRAAIRS